MRGIKTAGGMKRHLASDKCRIYQEYREEKLHPKPLVLVDNFTPRYETRIPCKDCEHSGFHGVGEINWCAECLHKE